MRQFRAVPADSKWKVSEGTATFLAGGMGSNFFWLGSFPFDAVKKRVVFRLRTSGFVQAASGKSAES